MLDSPAHEGNDTRSGLSHPDKRGVWLPRWVLDLIPDDLGAAMLLAQLLWWHQPAYGTNLPRARYQRGGHWWLLRADDEWGEECGLSLKQVRRIRRVLLAEGLIITARFKNAQGAPTTAWRPDFEAIQAAKLQNPEVPSEGQFHGSDPVGVVPSAPQGAVPIPMSNELEPEPLLSPNLRSHAFEDFWNIYPRREGKADARRAWTKLHPDLMPAVLMGAARYRDDPNREPEFTAHPATWLRAGRWEDDPLPARSANARPTAVDRSMENIAAVFADPYPDHIDAEEVR